MAQTPATADDSAKSSWLNRKFQRMLPSVAELEADELRERASDLRCVAVANAPLAKLLTLSGTLRTVTLRPRADIAALEAELYDGSGSVTLIWLGRRAIRGITPGRTVLATGRVNRQNGQLVMFNPTYELLPSVV
ncbi:MAG TPA: OB-fold nucleic acid binding domain-containing protein [Actinomycetes bacterium]|nr:OB-fold nucleic acid binding domain-containing protein [Actinomycetes bacterium]